MLRITCPRCGASAVSRRISSSKVETAYGGRFLPCEEIKERHAAGEDHIPKGECKTFDRAVGEAIARHKL